MQSRIIFYIRFVCIKNVFHIYFIIYTLTIKKIPIQKILLHSKIIDTQDAFKAFIFVLALQNNRIYHYTPEGTSESHPLVHDLRHPRLGKPRR